MWRRIYVGWISCIYPVFVKGQNLKSEIWTPPFTVFACKKEAFIYFIRILFSFLSSHLSFVLRVIIQCNNGKFSLLLMSICLINVCVVNLVSHDELRANALKPNPIPTEYSRLMPWQTHWNLEPNPIPTEFYALLFLATKIDLDNIRSVSSHCFAPRAYVGL